MAAKTGADNTASKFALLASASEFRVRIRIDLEFQYPFVATEYHLGLLKAKLAKYRSQLLEPSKKGEKGEGFDVLKSGDARVALIGFPSVGKSTMLSTLTKTESEAGKL